MTNKLRITGFTIAMILASVPASLVAQDVSLAIVGGRLIDGYGGPPLHDSVVLIAGKQIRAVGAESEIAIPNGTPVIEAEVANLTDAIANGLLKSSPALAARLQAAERELAKLRAESSQPARNSVQHIMPRLVDEYRALVDDLAESLRSVNVDRARAEIRKLIGDIRVNSTPDEIRLETREGAVETALLRAAGERQVFMVAGARFNNNLRQTVCLLTIPRNR